MKVLFGGAVLEPGWTGGEPLAGRLLLEGFRRRGVDVVRYAVPRRGIALAALAAMPWDADPVAMSQYRKVLRRDLPDVVLGFYDYDSSLCVACRQEKIPYIACVQIHWPACPIGTLYIDGSGVCSGPSFGKCLRHFSAGVPPSRLPGARSRIPPPIGSMVYAKFHSRGSILRQAARLIVPSGQMKRELDAVGYEHVDCVLSGISVEGFPARAWGGGAKTVVYPSGSPTERKGLPDFLELARILSPEFRDARFSAPNFGGNAFVPAMPYLSREALLELIADSYLAVLPILWDEPFGLVALEAMACERPVVAYASGALPEIIVDGETGILVPRGDRRALAAAVRTLLLDEPLAREMGAAGRRRVEDIFTLDRMTEGYLAIVRDVVPGLPVRRVAG